MGEGSFEQRQIADLAFHRGGSCGHKATAEAVTDQVDTLSVGQQRVEDVRG